LTQIVEKTDGVPLFVDDPDHLAALPTGTSPSGGGEEFVHTALDHNEV